MEAKTDRKTEKYVCHKGTIRVSGKSQAFKTGISAFHLFLKGVRPIEFVFLGGNAGHQAFKAAHVLAREIKNASGQAVGFSPRWAIVETHQEDGTLVEKDASVWSLVGMVPLPVPEKAETKPVSAPVCAVPGQETKIEAPKDGSKGT